ncbi:hypothetical protein CDAR_87731 [Caerostris darwini]|uniref:Uncharacterized protein n=1 Tax=Caerostris darwini TaxID=1538125 RepID=A0AAV4S488_9ARAC|nr:hypothetical protein CDAR_87731 [Caerostris darwini]
MHSVSQHMFNDTTQHNIKGDHKAEAVRTVSRWLLKLNPALNASERGKLLRRATELINNRNSACGPLNTKLLQTKLLHAPPYDAPISHKKRGMCRIKPSTGTAFCQLCFQTGPVQHSIAGICHFAASCCFNFSAVATLWHLPQLALGHFGGAS